MSRTHAAGNFFFLLDGEPTAAVLGNVGGGELKMEQAEIAHSTELHVQKTGSNASFSPISFDVSAAMLSKGLLAWFDLTTQRVSEGATKNRKNGWWGTLTADSKVARSKTFNEALITKVGGFDAKASDKGGSFNIQVEIQPELVQDVKGDGSDQKLTVTPGVKKLTKYNFRCGGLAGANLKRVSEVTGAGFTQKTASLLSGEARFPEIEPAGITYNDIKITLPQKDADWAFEWLDDAVRLGNYGADKERQFSLAFLDTAFKEELVNIDFDEVMIKTISEPKKENNKAEIAMVTIDLMVGKMTIKSNIT